MAAEPRTAPAGFHLGCRTSMPVLRRTGNDPTAWWTVPRRAPFDLWEVAAWHPWPSEVASVVLCRAMLAECNAHQGPPTVVVERLHILHDLHPFERVREKARCVLSEIGKDDN